MRKSRRRAVASLSLLLTLFPLGVPAQTAAPGTATRAPAPKPATLADALAAARPPQAGVALAVGAENVPLPKDAALPRPGATLGEVASAFGRLARHFGDVTAVAPPTMTVLNTNPGTPNIYDGMPPEDALKLLCASLTSGQWQALTGERGLGLSDLTGQDQRSLFLALFPGGVLKVQQSVPYEPGKPYQPGEERDLTGDLPQARVRLARRMMVMLPVEGNSGMHTGTYLDDLPGSPPRYHVFPARSGADTLYGAQVRAEVPNLPKKGQLDLSAPVLQATVPLTGVKTLGDLIGRIGDATHVELYADPHYERRTLTLVGSAGAAPAAPLLRALALCVTGTYRQVGPAFVLTDDLLGVGTRRLIWQQFEQEADARRKKPLDEAGDRIVLGGHSAGSLPDTGDGLAITPEQRKAYAARNPGMIDADDPANNQVTLPMAQLTPAQQDAARRVKDQLDKMHQQFPGGRQETTTLNGDISVDTQARLQLIVPTIDTPVDMENVSLWSLFQPSDTLRNARWQEKQKQRQAANPAPRGPAPPPPPPLAQVLRPIRRRAVLARARTAAEVRALVASMKAAGLNQLWLPVFFDGREHTALVAVAVRAARGTNIAVFPVLDLLQWGTDAPPDARDLTLLGQTSAQARADQYRLDALRNPEFAGPSPPTPVYVSPFAPGVADALRAAVEKVAAEPGIAGLVWRAVTPPGYEPPPSGPAYVSDGQNSLGYTAPARLAFLRKAHADPVDITAAQGRADTHLPEFDDYRASEDISKQWKQFRADADLALLRALRAAAVGAGQPLRLLVKAVGDDYNSWYATWDNPQGPPPAFRNTWFGGEEPPGDSYTQARRQSRLALVLMPFGAGGSSQALAAQIGWTFQSKPWDGFVLDATGPDAGPGGNPLAKLAAGMAAPGPRPSAAGDGAGT